MPQANPKSQPLYYLVFIEGFLVLSLQVLTAVLLTPYWGATFLFWSLQLGFVMLGLAAGYYLVPRWLEKRKGSQEQKIRSVLIAAFIYLLLLFPAADRVLLTLAASIDSPVTGLCFSLLIFIFAPLALLGSIPVLVIGKHDPGDEGRQAGTVFFISSLSGIFAVLLLAYVALPYWGLSYSVALPLFVFAGILYFFLSTQQKAPWGYAFAGLAVLATILMVKNDNAWKQNRSPAVKVLEVQHGVLGQLKIVESKGDQARFLYVNNAQQSKMHLSGRSLFPYVYSVVMYSTCRPPQSSVLLAGMGGGSLIYEYDRLGYNVDVVDIDARLPALARRHFLLPGKELNFIESDVRRYIKRSEKKYDVIVFDLSQGETVPTNVYTLECFRECKERLKPKGIVLLHFLSSLSERGQVALASVKRTLREAGFDCQLMNPLNKKDLLDGVTDPEKPDGFILMAAGKIDLTEANFMIDSSLMKELIPNRNNLFLQLDEKKGMLLTDDKPMLDVLQAENSLNMRRQNIRSFIKLRKHEK